MIVSSAGKMFPSRGVLHMAPFSDESLYIELSTKSSFWTQTNFHGVDLSALRDEANIENFRQPIVVCAVRRKQWNVGPGHVACGHTVGSRLRTSDRSAYGQ
jgi:hypothetical protein